jgi:hypothetical protein
MFAVVFMIMSLMLQDAISPFNKISHAAVAEIWTGVKSVANIIGKLAGNNWYLGPLPFSPSFLPSFLTLRFKQILGNMSVIVIKHHSLSRLCSKVICTRQNDRPHLGNAHTPTIHR